MKIWILGVILVFHFFAFSQKSGLLMIEDSITVSWHQFKDNLSYIRLMRFDKIEFVAGNFEFKGDTLIFDEIETEITVTEAFVYKEFDKELLDTLYIELDEKLSVLPTLGLVSMYIELSVNDVFYQLKSSEGQNLHTYIPWNDFGQVEIKLYAESKQIWQNTISLNKSNLLKIKIMEFVSRFNLNNLFVIEKLPEKIEIDGKQFLFKYYGYGER